MINTRYVIIIDDEGSVLKMANKLFEKEHEYQIIKVDSTKDEVKKAIIATVPDLVIINEDDLNELDSVAIVNTINKANELGGAPIVIVSSIEGKAHRIELLKRGVENFIKKPLDEEYFYYTIKSLVKLISNNRCISALTCLPGNIQIGNELKRRMAMRTGEYAVLYTDLDNFKSYNDKYGFMNGDEVIKFTSDVIQRAIQKYGVRGDFLGHIGGDDFVAIVDYANARKIGKNIVKLFDEEIIKFYTKEDAEKGWIRVPNRKGKLEKYPIMTITVAMISNKYKKYKSELEIGEDGASIKKKAKTLPGSNFMEDRRKKQRKSLM